MGAEELYGLALSWSLGWAMTLADPPPRMASLPPWGEATSISHLMGCCRPEAAVVGRWLGPLSVGDFLICPEPAECEKAAPASTARPTDW